ncbi:hypothetical protein PC121_g10581 [Phytophthora cactorum]|nr:hypothetical protein PC120_g20960 [Phytophthora cactorum]KAG3067324.1 hypothetical protein PC121_g10581 [Phytophthora cactorum]KAG4056533.1 hypothetical protein PC123_g8403 [Phytophthora cactorum]
MEYTIGKDKLLTLVVKLDLDVENELFEKGLPDPKVGMHDFLDSTPPRPSDEDVKAAPDEEDDVRNLEVCVIWQHLERKFGLGGAGVVDEPLESDSQLELEERSDPGLAAELRAEQNESEAQEGPRKGDDDGDDDVRASFGATSL